MEGVMILGVLGLIRIVTLTSERVALHELGQARNSTLATMGIGFGGAALVLWVMAIIQGDAVWINSTLWGGFIYALAFGLYTASLAKGQLGVVGPWSNATVVLLWCMHPEDDLLSILGVCIFGMGALLLTKRNFSAPVVWMLLSDVLLASARFIDVNHVKQSPIAYSACLFTVIGLWMFVPIVFLRKTQSLIHLVCRQPGWSFIAASSNAGAYISLFILLRFLHPATVEAVSALASLVTTLCGIYFFHEQQAVRKVVSSGLMTIGSILLLSSAL